MSKDKHVDDAELAGISGGAGISHLDDASSGGGTSSPGTGGISSDGSSGGGTQGPSTNDDPNTPPGGDEGPITNWG